jgi:NitT/TauT family transport system substrate-binding protein
MLQVLRLLVLVLSIPGMGFALANGRAHAAAVTVAYAAVPDYIALFVAKEHGIFEKNGLDVTLQMMSNSAVIPPALLSHSVQMAGIPDAVFIQAVSNGLDLKMFSAVGYTPKEIRNGSVIARTGLDLKEAKDFIGRKVGISGIGSFFQILFLKWLEDRNVDPRKVNFVETPFLQMSDLLKAGQVDAVAVAQPFINRIVSAGIGYEVAPYISQLGQDIPIGGFAAEAGWAAQNKASVDAFRTSIHQAIERIRADPDIVAPMLIKYLKMTPEILKNIPLNRTDDTLLPEQLDFWQDIMLHQGLITNRVDTKALILR